LAIVDCVMARLKTNILRVHTGGVRDGLLLSLLDRGEEFSDDAERQESAVEQFALRCGVDVVHSQHVAWLAGRLFDQLTDVVCLQPADRRLLTTAANLRDSGYLISYKSHHKHSYQLILNSRLPGFRKHELALVAAIARYHRGANPKKKHSHFRHLSRSDQQRVLQLAAILRIAGGLDRGYLQRVHEVRVVHAPGRVNLLVEASSNPELEIWSARGHSQLFEKVVGTHLSVTAAEPHGAAGDEELHLIRSRGDTHDNRP
jgi:exopolyphosphatase/guanosine-5'-triphosphate,3'-diphosphate pyrophosphatase